MKERDDPSWWSHGYMTPLHPDAFRDHTKKEMTGTYHTQECLQCHGYGGWNLKLCQYVRQVPPRNHFRASCNNCDGWGYTTQEDHIHQYGIGAETGKCLRQYTCTICGNIRTIDSKEIT